VKVVFSFRALNDVDQIGAYILLLNPPASERVTSSIVNAANALGEHPELGRALNRAGIRRLIEKDYGYLIYYRYIRRSEIVSIVTVQHPAKRQPYRSVL
jgi:plasmid stabilization system protein ParE